MTVDYRQFIQDAAWMACFAVHVYEPTVANLNAAVRAGINPGTPKGSAMPTIDARAAWMGDTAECRRLYRQFIGPFHGRFGAIRAHYGWKRAAMLRALRIGKH